MACVRVYGLAARWLKLRCSCDSCNSFSLLITAFCAVPSSLKPFNVDITLLAYNFMFELDAAIA
jgi:hypothetical protein